MKLILALLLMLPLPLPVAASHDPEATAELEHAAAYAEFLTGSTDVNDIEPFAAHVVETLQELGPTPGCEDAYPVELTVWLMVRRAATEWQGHVDAEGKVNAATSQRAAGINGAAQVLTFFLGQVGCDI